MVETPPKTAPRLFLIDGYALIYRAFFAFVQRPLQNSKGENTSAPFGFAHFLIRIRETLDPDYLAVVFDAGMSDREKAYPAYKATREKMPDALEASLPRIRELVAGFRDEVVELQGYEADDVIGTLARQAREAGIEAVIVSGDKDFYQLVGPGVHLLNPGRGGSTGVAAEWVDERNASERLGVPPERVVDYLALIGDSSDNVPGAPGIGPKTALQLLEQFGSLDAMLERVDEIPQKRARESLLQHADQVQLSRQLVTIRDDLPVALDLERLKVHAPDRARLRQLFVELEFRTLAESFADRATEVTPQSEVRAVDHRILLTPGEVADAVTEIRRAGRVSVDTETSSLHPMEADLVGLSLSWEAGKGVYLPFRHRGPGSDGGFLDSLSNEAGPTPNLPPLMHPDLLPLRELLEDETLPKVGQNLKYDLLVLRREGIHLGGISFDTMIASYVLDPGRRSHGLDALSTDFLGISPIAYAEVTGRGRKQIPFAEVPLEEATAYACEDADLAFRLYERFDPQLDTLGLRPLFRDLEMPLLPVLAQMEWTGIRIDADVFRGMSRRLERDLSHLQADIWKAAGEEFNINSNPKLREVLYERLGLPVLKRTKTGPSTEASVLEELAGLGHALPLLLLEYRQLEKLRSTYVDALPRLVHPKTGRIHASFNQAVAATGRLSSSDPNLQNIPIRTSVGREIRKGFIPEEGALFLSADYSQIELRILAHFSGDEAFVTAFREDRDVHRQTAAAIFGVPIEAVTSEQRNRAKTINFATLYGQGEFSLAQQLGVTREEAGRFISHYFEQFRGVRQFLDAQVELARDQGYVETLLGRRRYIPELKSGNWNVRQFGERIAQNTPIQGTAADLIKKAMLAIHCGLKEEGFGARLLVQVHDELVFEVPEDEVEATRAWVVREMESAMVLNVPLRVEVGVGASWYDCK
jgi:DNA polymerase I